MKKIGLILLSLMLSIQVYAQQTETNTTFEDISYNGTPIGGVENEYGEIELYKEATIRTRNFKVDNFWDKFKSEANAQSIYTNVTKLGTFKLTIEASFACKNDGLEKNGCSGQKPFLINSDAFGNPELKLDEAGNPLSDTGNEYRIPYDAAVNYLPTRDDAFYALDVFRDGKYYSEEAGEEEISEGRKSFFASMVSFFTNYFSKDQTIYGGVHSTEQRNRYLANIRMGLQKEYKLEKAGFVNTSDVNLADENKVVSLIDYNSEMITETTGCSGIIFSFDPDSATCKVMNFFNMSNYMPFANNEDQIKIETTSVLADTETTLLALAGELDGIDYIAQKTEIDENGNRSFIQEIFKPMATFMGGMGRFFFGENSQNITELLIAEFEFDKFMPLDFIEVGTDGHVVGFRHFELLGLESVYGTEVESCRVRDTRGFFGWASTYKTFTKGIDTNTEICLESGFFLFNNYREEDFNQLNVTTNNRHRIFMSDWGQHDVANISTDEWLDWCKRNQGRQNRGIFGRMIDNFTSIILGENINETHDDQLDALLSDENYSVDKYIEKVHKGLILHLRDKGDAILDVGDAGTTTTYKLMNVR